MAYDEDLAVRGRDALPGDLPVDERKMFGGLAFLIDGRMVCSVVKDTLMLGLGAERAEHELT